MGPVVGVGAVGANADVVVAAVDLQEALMLAAQLVLQVSHGGHDPVGLQRLHLPVRTQVRLAERARAAQTRLQSLGGKKTHKKVKNKSNKFQTKTLCILRNF